MVLAPPVVVARSADGGEAVNAAWFLDACPIGALPLISHARTVRA